jgi:non-lysosomal glucosylceramidase
MPSDNETENKKEGLGRRTFLNSAGVLGAGLLTSGLPVAAGPFSPGEPTHGGVPENKKLNQQWTGSLTERGIPTTYLKSKNELRFIGMPVGGIMTGTLYLGGDGRLWLWDIFNSKHRGIDPKEIIWEPLGRKVTSTDGAAYLEPPPSSAKHGIEQGFAIKVKCNGKEYIRQLREADWEEVSFTGQYPLAAILFTDRDLPFSVTMEAYSPFIPLNADDSGLPATVFSITVHNKSKSALEATLVGWLENACLFYQKDKPSFKRQNTRIKDDNVLAVFSESKLEIADSKIAQLPDYGTMCLSVLSDNGVAYTNFNTLDLRSFNFKQQDTQMVKEKEELLTGGVLQNLKILSGKNQTAHFVLSWHFPNSDLKVKDAQAGNYFSKRFNDAFEVAQYLGKHFQRLEHDTKLWRDTWQDSTLPHWFLERTFSNTSTLATTTCHRFGTGRFWSWEGVGCCEGTCTHVWQYAQAVARIFPEIERDTRERVDLGLAFNEQTGEIGYRGEGTGEAIDGQAGTVLRIYREHQMSKDNSFLKTNWPHIKKAVEFILNHDTNKDGIIDGAQPNTLDAAWYGEISWISSLCLAAWRAGEEMALEMNDDAFAKICNQRYLTGKKNIEEKLFNGEYFIQLPGKEGKKFLGSYDTCLIDQVFGQSYAYQLGLGRILDKEKMHSALKALWKYNFMPDVGPYIAHHKGGRPYALSGEGGMLMDTNPRKNTDPYGINITWQAGYFNECMSGFEHQVASHLMAEGMVEESLVLTRSIHDRYHASKRNPYNEIECSDHYARAMASYGTFITACGFEYNGPKGYIGFAPQIHPENFKAPFTTAEGWGTFEQRQNKQTLLAKIHIKKGSLSLQKISLQLQEGTKAIEATCSVGNKKIALNMKSQEGRIEIEFISTQIIHEGEVLAIEINGIRVHTNRGY